MSIYPFDNTVQVVEIKGSTIKEALEHSVEAYPSTFEGFLSVSGMTYSFDPTQPAGHRVQEVYINNEPLDDSKIYRLASMDFLFSGGDGYDMFKNLEVIGKYENAEEVVSAYLRKVGIGKVDISRIKLIKGNEISTELNEKQIQEKEAA